MRSARLEGRVVVISGAASGIGLQIARECIGEGATVAALDISETGLAAVRQESKAQRWEERISTHLVDITSDSQVRATIEGIEQMHGGVDALVHSAYWTLPRAAVDTEETDFVRTLDVTLKGGYLLCKYAIPSMLARGRGTIVPIASVHSMVAFEGFFSYQIAKAGLLGLVRSIAADYGPTIRCNALTPGAVETPALQDATPEVRRSVINGALLKRAASAAEIAKAAIFLLSDDSSFMTGTSLVVDGGWTAV